MLQQRVGEFEKASEYDQESPQLQTRDQPSACEEETQNNYSHMKAKTIKVKQPGLDVIKLEFVLRLKIKQNDWLLADMCPQAANHSALF